MVDQTALQKTEEANRDLPSSVPSDKASASGRRSHAFNDRQTSLPSSGSNALSEGSGPARPVAFELAQARTHRDVETAHLSEPRVDKVRDLIQKGGIGLAFFAPELKLTAAAMVATRAMSTLMDLNETNGSIRVERGTLNGKAAVMGHENDGRRLGIERAAETERVL